MFISKTEKRRIENNIKFLIDEIQMLRTKIEKFEKFRSKNWNTVPAEKYLGAMLDSAIKDQKKSSPKRSRSVMSKTKSKEQVKNDNNHS
jgi:hypothetical protein